MTHFLVVVSATVEFWNFKIDILGVQCPVNHAESGFNTNINLNIQGFFQLFFLDVLICLIKLQCFQWFICKISDQKPQQPSSLGSLESYYIYIKWWYFLD